MQQEDVFQAYKPLLFSIAYNMLGSVMDAEDCVQEAFLRWYQASDKSENNCRQIVRRARQHLGVHRSLYPASREQQDAILHQFLRACRDGDMNGLLDLFANDIVMYSDSGGKAPAARNPIYGEDRVARLLLGFLRKAPENYRSRVALINGQPGLINYVNRVPAAMLTLDMLD